MHGTVKSYDADKKELSLTDSNGKNMICSTGVAKVRLNKVDSKVEETKIGDKVLAVLEPVGDKAILTSLMIERK